MRSHVLRVAAGDLLGGIAESQDLLDLVGGLEGDGEPSVEMGLVPVHLAQGEDLGAEFTWADGQPRRPQADGRGTYMPG